MTNTAIELSPKIRRRQNRTRQRILDESARLFVAKGFENVSVEEIIAAADIARSSFYRFFANREAVLANLVRPVFEQGIAELDAIGDRAPRDVMHAIIEMYLTLWKSNPDALRVSTRVGGVYFYLFEDVHRVFREKLAATLAAIEPSGVFLNGSADLTGRIIARTAITMMAVYSESTEFESLFRRSMRGLLLNPDMDADG